MVVGPVLVLAACSSAAGRAPAANTAGPVASCADRTTTVTPGPQLSPQTGERGVIYTVTNRGPRPCALAGYPQVLLRDAAGQALPFRYRRGGPPYVTRRPPRPVTLAPGGRAYLLVAKYRCDLGYPDGDARLWSATTIDLRLPGEQTNRRLAAAYPAGAFGIVYCAARGDVAGRSIEVSPVEPSLPALVGG